MRWQIGKPTAKLGCYTTGLDTASPAFRRMVQAIIDTMGDDCMPAKNPVIHSKPKPKDSKRSPEWPKVRRAHLAKHPACEACGIRSMLQVHHVIPFHVKPELELDPSNLYTLCEHPAHDCHFHHGHHSRWANYVPGVVDDVERYRSMTVLS